MVLTYLRVQSLHASVASSVHSHDLAVLHAHVITADDVNYVHLVFKFHASQ